MALQQSWNLISAKCGKCNIFISAYPLTCCAKFDLKNEMGWVCKLGMTSPDNPRVHPAKGKPSKWKAVKHPLLRYKTSQLREFMQFGLRDPDQDEAW